MEKIWIRDQGSRMEKIWIQNPGYGMEKNRIRDPGSGINIPDQQNWKSRRQICQDLKNRVIIESFVEKAFWDGTKSFLQSKAASLALKRGKTPVNWIFHSPTRHGCCRRTTSPGAKPLLQLTFIMPQHRFRVVFGLKRPSMSVQNFFFARPVPKKPSPPLFSITGCEKSIKMFSQLHFVPYFTPATFYPFLKVKSELASCLLTQGTLKKSLQGVAPTIIT